MLHRGSSCSLAHNVLISSCQSAATSEIVKRFLDTSVTHVSSAVASTSTFTFTFTLRFILVIF